MDAYCQRCQANRQMENPQEITLSNGDPATRGDCPGCGGKIYSIGKSFESAPAVERQVPRCFCGIVIAEANRLCTELDCFYRS